MYKRLSLLVTFAVAAVASPVHADGCLPGEPCYEGATEAAAAPDAMMPMKEKCKGWGNRLSAGAPVYFFDDEDDYVGGGIYLDTYHCCRPINLRVGAEVSHIDLEQDAAQGSAEYPGKDVNATFIRVPFSVEYVANLGSTTNLFMGGGPDIISTANDVSDTTVGLHVSARLVHEFGDHFGIGVEGGYMWAEVDDDGGPDINLDGAFVIPTVSYKF